MSKFIVITTINYPSQAVARFAELRDWTLVVVGDRKTPPDWRHENVVYLSPDDQDRLPFETSRLLPWNHYCRKMVGYLYAMTQGATLIADTDDDNIPRDGWGSVDLSPVLPCLTGPEGFVNVYRHFSQEHVWPRGLPLSRIKDDTREWALSEADRRTVGVWQYLADGDPDVDAIYRLVADTPVQFDAAPPIALDQGIWSPFNSQNTFFRRELFPLLYLPGHVTFRFTDILRGLVAQPLMWRQGYLLAFGGATVVQERNPHDYFEDFKSEVPMFLQVELAAATAALAAGDDVVNGMALIYDALRAEGVVTAAETALLSAWLRDVAATGWQPGS